ncbi:MAG: BtpA/SgcQ family protein [Anaerolineaceae bacterium]
MENWIKSIFNITKPVIGMCHFKALPGDPQYDPEKGLEWVVETALADLLALQDGGVDAVMFSNESSLPYLTTACLARIVAELKPKTHIPFGVNVLWDPAASIDLAMATGASFVREIFTGVYASDFGLWNTRCGEVIRHQHAIHAEHVKLLFNIVPEAASYLGTRAIEDIARSTVFNNRPDGLCVSGLTAGAETSDQTLQRVKSAVPETPVFANTGVRVDNVVRQLSIADGAIIGTAFKKDGFTWNAVETARVKAIMDQVKTIR